LGWPFRKGGLEASHRAQAQAALETVGIADLSERYIGDLPYGDAKRADIARALASEPSLLLLDEPAAGLNEAERLQLADLVARLVDGPVTLVLIEHDMTFVARVCDRLLVLVQGQRVYEGNTSEALHDETVIESFLGQAAAKTSEFP
jgi:branched-chain amino acid transport system ATP-binding protein